jgi:hypothetical protein
VNNFIFITFLFFFLTLGMKYIFSPLDQFEIRDLILLNLPILGDTKISFTNISLYLTLGFFLVLFFNTVENNYNTLIFTR